MKRHLARVLICVLWYLQGTAVWATTNDVDNPNGGDAPRNRIMTPAAIERDLTLLKESYERVHPGYTRYTPKQQLDAHWRDVLLKAQRDGGMRVGDFYQAVQLGLANVRCDHTKAELPASLKEARRTLPVYLPVRWRFVEARGFIEYAAPDSGLKAKDELLAIDGVSLQALRARYTPFISVDGFTDHVKDAELAFSSEFMGGAIEHFLGLAPTNQPAAMLRIRRQGVEMELQVQKLNFSQWRALQEQYSPFRRNFVDHVSWTPLGETGALLDVGTFVNYRKPVDPDSVYGPLIKAINEQQRDKLIIDLRRNGGGSSDASLRLLAHLMEKPEYLQREAHVKDWKLEGLKAHLSTWDQSALNAKAEWFEPLEEGGWRIKTSMLKNLPPLAPAKHVFTGDVVVLSSHTNASGVTSLVSKLKDAGRITVIGENTGGSSTGPTANIMFFLTLPESGVIARLPAQRVINNVSGGVEGKGVSADLEVIQRVEDWLSDNDAVLAAARQHLGI